MAVDLCIPLVSDQSAFSSGIPSRLDDEGSNSFKGNSPETPSPCVKKAARKRAKWVSKTQSENFAGRNRAVLEFMRSDQSGKFTALVPNIVGAFPEALGEALNIQEPNDEQQEGHTNEQQKSKSPSSQEAVLTPFEPGDHTIHEIFEHTSRILQRSYKEDALGRAYIFYNTATETETDTATPFFKIGSSSNVRTRKSTHQRVCHLSTWESTQRPARSIRSPVRLERLVQAELRNLRYTPSCACTANHSEYFWGSKDMGLAALEFWAGWLERFEPFDERDRLGGFWADRLVRFQGRLLEYFKCDGACEGGEEEPACQACLRAGWIKWANPTPGEEVEYACRTTIPWKWVRSLIQGFNSLRPVNHIYVLAFVGFLGQVVALWRFLSNPRLSEPAIALSMLGPYFGMSISFPALSAFFNVTFGTVCLVSWVQKLVAEPQDTQDEKYIKISSDSDRPPRHSDPVPRRKSRRRVLDIYDK